MMDHSLLLITLGVLFIGGLAADWIGHFTRLPRVTMLLLLGLLAGKAGFDLIPGEITAWFDLLSVIALTMIAFLLGGALSRKNLAAHGKAIIVISLTVVITTLGVVTGGLMAAGVDASLALVLGAIATATAPAAMTDVIRQSGIQNGYTDTLKGVVAIDDLWGLIVFSLVLIAIGQSDGWAGLLAGSMRELGGALLLGAAIGVPASFLTGRLAEGEPLQAEAIGVVFITAGLAIWLDVSFLIAGMTAGAVIVNTARHHDRAFNEIEHIQWPFMLLFFLLAGASLEINALWSIGWTGLLYIGLRIVSRLAGGWAGSRLGGVRTGETAWYGPALLPQAGVAVGMALVAGEAVPELYSAIMALTIASTVLFEIIGPPITLLAIRRVARARQQDGA